MTIYDCVVFTDAGTYHAPRGLLARWTECGRRIPEWARHRNQAAAPDDPSWCKSCLHIIERHVVNLSSGDEL